MSAKKGFANLKEHRKSYRKPISTAPKDGTSVVVFNDEGAWIAQWHARKDGGNWEFDNHAEYETPFIVPGVTHWMPSRENEHGRRGN